uniref:Putative secreted peptide n=1 Tax=Anopheles braziliensis TaxID=58242 RepID=A0A2M3ZXL3_9DIPT
MFGVHGSSVTVIVIVALGSSARTIISDRAAHVSVRACAEHTKGVRFNTLLLAGLQRLPMLLLPATTEFGP